MFKNQLIVWPCNLLVLVTHLPQNPIDPVVWFDDLTSWHLNFTSLSHKFTWLLNAGDLTIHLFKFCKDSLTCDPVVYFDKYHQGGHWVFQGLPWPGELLWMHYYAYFWWLWECSHAHHRPMREPTWVAAKAFNRPEIIWSLRGRKNANVATIKSFIQLMLRKHMEWGHKVGADLGGRKTF